MGKRRGVKKIRMVHGIKEDYGIEKEQKYTMKYYQDIGRLSERGIYS